ncbi:hypothetical protein, partial [Thiolapillus sp.]|uniref:hypothetical protein n=1 Tax=Thiolapillus sp. TaxID=2017437 RepID=UPI003AF4DFD8
MGSTSLRFALHGWQRARRDLTINAIAMDREGRIIDPFHGRQDLEQRILRHLPSFS